ncbi:MAG TPA: response regulator [Candidatus Angelobacter sp.]
MVPIALVVDDSMLIRHTVCRYFEERGCRVESATNGEEALAMLQDLHPDIIITDLQMPKMDGYQLIKALKSRPQTAAIPIVILAAAKSRAEKAEETQADFVVFKDIDIESQLGQVLKKARLFSDGTGKDSAQS